MPGKSSPLTTSTTSACNGDSQALDRASPWRGAGYSTPLVGYRRRHHWRFKQRRPDGNHDAQVRAAWASLHAYYIQSRMPDTVIEGN
ncbi:hypothetical protein P154DRAFT_198927 [Amniculicola lignicola CBS 123094]|uniref:Uncharacterized protein n=1 Tax=Amniculicola lignicola CBS 123094 TaxID=1392246 RepID=A0A6A5WI44_9PLEO|nr:hypothetical protein P154DRAFT_198927 [Amniculicola lignicola CBS 123094]